MSRTTILITRPQAAAERFASLLGDIDAEVIIAPVLALADVHTSRPGMPKGPLVFTSQAAIRRASEEFNLSGQRCYVVGEESANIAISLGMEVIGQAPDAKSLCDQILRTSPVDDLTYYRGAEISFDLEKQLADAGINISSRIVYRQVQIDLTEKAKGVFRGDTNLILPLFSARSCANLSEQIMNMEICAHVHLIGISQHVLQSWKGKSPFSTCHAEEPNNLSMVMKVKEIVDAIS